MTTPQSPLAKAGITECYHSGGKPEDCDKCWQDADNWAEIGRLVARADDALVKALTSAGQARAAIESLISAQVYDIEMAEGTDGPDAVAELHRAALSLRHAHRIIAHRKRLLAEEN